MQPDILIIGAGPAGLLAACWASQYPVSVRIIDKSASRKPTGHADGIHSRTLEILDSFGIDGVIRYGVVDNVSCYWGRDGENGELRRKKRVESQPDTFSRFEQRLLNQGAIEQMMIDYLTDRGVQVEWSTEAVSLDILDKDDFPVTVQVNSSRGQDVIKSRYAIACDGAHSWTRDALQVPMDTSSEDSIWGVMDIVPITDFPDIRHSCAIHSPSRGSIMQLPRENGLVRLYIHLKGDEDIERNDRETPKRLLQIAQRTYEPYQLDYERCDWYSLYRIGQRLVSEFRIRDRIFLAGDAAHTHSPKGGQGLNVSMQDTYNLVWKLASVIMGILKPSILETYHSERYAVAQELMRMDSELVQGYEQESSEGSEDTAGLDEIRHRYVGFMTGVAVKYPANPLVASVENSLARNIELGMRLPSFFVANQASSCPLHLAERLVSNGYWRVLVFPGDIRPKAKRDSLVALTADMHSCIQSMRLPVETLLIHNSPQTEVSLLDLPDYGQLAGDHSRVFADRDAYVGYGIQSACVVVCRPDQHVAWIGPDIVGLKEYFSIQGIA